MTQYHQDDTRGHRQLKQCWGCKILLCDGRTCPMTDVSTTSALAGCKAAPTHLVQLAQTVATFVGVDISQEESMMSKMKQMHARQQ